METKRFVGNFVNVILTRQTCGQRSSRAVESKRRAIGNNLSGRICYMGDRDLGLCTTSGLAFGEPQRNDKFLFFLRRNTFFFRKSPLRCGPKLCTYLDLSLLCILILGTYSKFARTNNFLALGLCFPQSCSSAGRMFTASRSHLQYYRRIVSFPQQKIR